MYEWTLARFRLAVKVLGWSWLATAQGQRTLRAINVLIERPVASACSLLRMEVSNSGVWTSTVSAKHV